MILKPIVATAAVATALLLSACGGTSGETHARPELPASVSEDAKASQPTEPSAKASQPTAPSSGPVDNERGNIVKVLGEGGGFGSPAAPILAFAVDAIAPAECSSDWEKYGSEPENGHLMAVDFRMSTAAAPVYDLKYFTVSALDFKYIDTNGITHSDLGTVSTYSCLDSNESFTSDSLSPASKYVGKIVLDLPAESGTLVYAPSITDGGWEWDF